MPSPRDAQHPLALRASPSLTEGDSTGGSWGRDDPSLAVRLASAEQTLRDISHALAHDLRTSLRHVASYAQLLSDPAHAGQSEQSARLALKVLEASRRLQRLMESVAALARLQAVDLQPEVVDMAAMVRSVVRELDDRGGGVRVACRVAQHLPPARADALLLRRVWQELLDNAWRHSLSHAAPCIDVHCEPVPGGSAYFVHDNGLGFDPEKTAELFGLFHRAQSAPSPGLGLGLAMVRRIVECHGGRVWATARPGEGASFGFSLPDQGG
ncbi:MAG: ATP-binding protein [Hydrogenophaga sp.]|jgi:light-regulated signal transduction histidine kinase (bacteriophytochrome)|nr:ATP-binding protein [Hydrogenophaga sp.]